MSYNKYYLYKKQVSNDNGQTWEDVTPLETVPSGDVIATYDTLAECESGSTDYAKQYLTFVAEGRNCSFTFTPNNSNVIYFSLNSGRTWIQGTGATVSSGNKVMWKGEMTPSGVYSIGSFSASSTSFNVEGNIMSLLYGDNFSGQTSLSGKYQAFAGLFYDCASLFSAENLILPATTLADYCYYAMFRNCRSLMTAPQLPATTLAPYCYRNMFKGCESLTTAPQLPATTLALGCYYEMFSSCTSLTTAPELLATTLAQDCYYGMFANCTSLTTAMTVLPATALTEQCYYSMFKGCSRLRTAPELPAPRLGSEATFMLSSYAFMFKDCTRLNYIKCLLNYESYAEDFNVYRWVEGVASSGTFVKASSMTSWVRGDNGIPTNWTVQNA